MDAEFPRFVGRGTDHATTVDAAYDYGLAAQFGMVALLDRRVESVHIHMEDRGVRVHGGDVVMALVMTYTEFILRMSERRCSRAQPYNEVEHTYEAT